MRTAPLVFLTLATFLFVLLAPPFVTNAQAGTVNPPTFLRNCDGTRSSALPNGPYGIAVSQEQATRMFIVQVIVSTVLIMLSACSIDGTFGSGMNGPTGILLLSALSRIYVADCGNSRIMVYSILGAFLFSFGVFGTLPGQMQFPYGIAHSPPSRNERGIDLIYVADTYNNRIQYYTADGIYQGHWGTAGTGNGEFAYPRGIAVDATGNVYVSDTDNHRIQKFTSTGTYVTQWGSNGSGDGQFSGPNGLEIGPVDVAAGAGTTQAVYVADTGNDRVQIFSEDGTYLTQFGATGSAEGQFNGPADVGIDANGEVYVTDQFNLRVQVFGYPSSVAEDTWGGIKAMFRTAEEGAGTR
ncbi:hypothetical protein K8I85_03995 [bacterium]|nr:hypothetical protein [bacterium]